MSGVFYKVYLFYLFGPNLKQLNDYKIIFLKMHIFISFSSEFYILNKLEGKRIEFKVPSVKFAFRSKDWEPHKTTKLLAYSLIIIFYVDKVFDIAICFCLCGSIILLMFVPRYYIHGNQAVKVTLQKRF